MKDRRQQPPVAFDEKHAAQFDQKFVKLAPLRNALHLLISAVFGDLPTDARILCVGAGTGQEMIYLARKFPQWSFTAVEPSRPMLKICRRKAEEHGIADRCQFHKGYLDTLPAGEAFDAATSLLVSQFILEPPARVDFFRTIAGRLRPRGRLVSADLAGNIDSEGDRSLFEVWLRLMQETGLQPEDFEKLRSTYRRDVALLPITEVRNLIVSGGFESPMLFLQTGLIHAWYADRSAE